MSDAPAPKKKRNRQNENARRTLQRRQKAAAQAVRIPDSERELQIKEELAVLAIKAAGNPTDTDRDIDFAYRHSANPTLTPLQAPSLGAWRWYEYAIDNPQKFLEICAKREDAKAKMAGTVSDQRMEDDRRQQFAVIDRIVSQLQLDVKGIVKELMEKFPEDVLNECRKNKAAWSAYFAKYPFSDSR